MPIRRRKARAVKRRIPKRGRRKTGLRKRMRGYAKPDKEGGKVRMATIAHENWLETFMPPQLLTTHVYGSQVTLAPDTVDTSIAKEGFNLNWLYDPDQTDVGHQPRGYDQLKAFYYSYLVEEVKYDIQFFQASSVATTTNAVNSMCGIFFGPQGYGGQFVNRFDYDEMPIDKFHKRPKIMTRLNVNTVTAATPMNGLKFRGTIKLRDIHNAFGPRDFMNGTVAGSLKWPSDYTGSVLSPYPRPNTTPQLILWAHSMNQDGAESEGALPGVLLPIPYTYANVRLTYVVKWFCNPRPGYSASSSFGATGATRITHEDGMSWGTPAQGVTGDIGIPIGTSDD